MPRRIVYAHGATKRAFSEKNFVFQLHDFVYLIEACFDDLCMNCALLDRVY